MTVLVPHDPRWAALFVAAAAQVRRLGRDDWLVEHIGSTAVPGLPAKPIIDLAVRVRDDEDFLEHVHGLERGGWSLGSAVRSHRVMVLERSGRRTHIAHFFAADRWETCNQRIFRDWLLGHPEDAAEYAAVKTAAAVAARAEGTPYNAAKAAVVQTIMDRARADRGLPVIPVSDK